MSVMVVPPLGSGVEFRQSAVIQYRGTIVASVGGDSSSKNGVTAGRGMWYVYGMSTYGQFCPVAKAAEIFAERWTPLILRELLCGSHRFGELERGLPRISRSLLSQRLRSLEEAGLIERR